MDFLDFDSCPAFSADTPRNGCGAIDDGPQRAAAEQPPMRDRRRHHRWPVEIFGRLVIGSRSHPARTIDLSLGGALVAAVAGARAGTYGQLELPSLGSLRCRIVAVSALGCHLAFEHEASPPVACKVAASDADDRRCARDPRRRGQPRREADAPATVPVRALVGHAGSVPAAVWM